MPYRILEYETEIMKSAIDIRKVKNKEYKLPLVIPIVLYTGKKKWDAKRYLEPRNIRWCRNKSRKLQFSRYQ